MTQVGPGSVLRTILRRPVRSGLTIAFVILAVVGTLTVVHLGGIRRQLAEEDRVVSRFGSMAPAERVALLGGHREIAVAVADLYRTFIAGISTTLALLLGCYVLARRGASDRELIRRQQAIMGRSQDAVFILSPEGVILEMNRIAEGLFGYASAEVVGRPFTEFVAPDSIEEARTAFARSLELGSHSGTGIRGLRKDGSVATVDFHSLMVSGERPMLISIVRDVTRQRETAAELARSQEQLRQAQKMEAIGLLAGGVAHDFNNALTVINGYSELVLSEMPERDPNRARVEEIGRAGERAADITRQLLAFSRRQRSQLGILDLNATIRDIAKMLQRLVGEDVAMVTHLEPGLGRILADGGHMQQVLMNLAVNARDAMPGGGNLEIETRMVGSGIVAGIDSSFVRLTVRDTGCGMDSATQARVFEPFFTTKEAGKGTGLGLSIVFGIVKDAGGVIAIESAPGRGSAFIIDLPEVIATVPAAAAAPAPAPDRVARGTLLVVEDDARLREFTRDALAGRGYEVLAAGDGDAAFACARAHPGPIDLMICDLVLPGLPCEELTARMREDRPAMKHLCVTGYPDRVRLHPLVATGELPFLEKPFTATRLAAAVADLLAQPAGAPAA